MRYAKALMAFATGKGAEERVYEEMRTLLWSFERYADLKAALDNPVLTVKEKYSLLCKAISGNTPVSDETDRFITLVLGNHREAFLPYICIGFMDLFRKSRHIGVAKLTTAVPVADDVKERIRSSSSTVLHARMELYTEVDPAIEGGFIFDINDVRLDASIATQLRRVKEQFIDKNRRIV